jgi:alkanesulfonate monooxygenase SsuD/methylene tetrahydromethanopterin reductase-like flavin-dependent oxidoreductase (luciferase family)
VTGSGPLAVGLTPMETRRDVILHVAIRGEQLGYEGFFLAEGWGYDAPVLLAEIALRTSRIRLGSGVLNVWGRSAAQVAMLATTLHELSGGRFTLGLGAGSPQLAEGLHGVPFRAPIDELAAVTRQVRRLLHGERLVPSTPVDERPLRLATRPAPGVPIYLGALGPRAVQLTGELADGWYPFLLPITALPRSISLLKEGAGRGDACRPLPRVCPCLPTAVSPDPVQARAMAAWWVCFYLVSMGPLYRNTIRSHGYGPAVDAVLAANPTQGTNHVPAGAQVLIDDLTISGDADTARTALDRWRYAGAETPVLALPPNRSLAELDHILESFSPHGS